MIRINETINDIELDLLLKSTITVICGDSATGKSYVYQLLKDLNIDDSYFINYESVKNTENYKSAIDYIKHHSNKLVIIDQADEIQHLNDDLMYYINTDKNDNTFLVIGRGPKLNYQLTDLAELEFTNNKFTLKYTVDQP